MITPRKVLKLLKGPRGFNKALVAINSTPLRFLIKRGVGLFYLRKKALRKSVGRTLRPGPEGQAHVDSLRRDGFAVVGPVMDQALLAELQAASIKLVQKADAIQQAADTDSAHFSKKNFWARLLDEEVAASRLTTDSIFVRFALQPQVISAVTEYFGEVPVIGYVFLSLSRYVHEPLTASQLWHRDRDDVKVLKLFTYLSDVEDEASGPFTFYPRRLSESIKNSFVPKHMPDAEMLKQTGNARPTQMFGRTFASFLVDTSCCYHMGSRVEEGKSRLMYTASFVSAPSMFPNFDNQIVIARPPSEVERLLLRV
jgi:hypothetical protein